jgi:hypothetical protein
MGLSAVMTALALDPRRACISVWSRSRIRGWPPCRWYVGRGEVCSDAHQPHRVTPAGPVDSEVGGQLDHHVRLDPRVRGRGRAEPVRRKYPRPRMIRGRPQQHPELRPGGRRQRRGAARKAELAVLGPAEDQLPGRVDRAGDTADDLRGTTPAERPHPIQRPLQPEAAPSSTSTCPVTP